MSVKAENRPENRFQIYVSYARFEKELIPAMSQDEQFSIVPDDFGKAIQCRILEHMIDARKNLLAANEMNVFDDIQYADREHSLISAIHDLEMVKSAFEMFFSLTESKSIADYVQAFTYHKELISQIRSLLKSDTRRHQKGEKATAAEFAAAKKKSFYEKKYYDPSSTDPAVRTHADPFGIAGLVLNFRKS